MPYSLTGSIACLGQSGLLCPTCLATRCSSEVRLGRQDSSDELAYWVSMCGASLLALNPLIKENQSAHAIQESGRMHYPQLDQTQQLHRVSTIISSQPAELKLGKVLLIKQIHLHSVSSHWPSRTAARQKSFGCRSWQEPSQSIPVLKMSRNSSPCLKRSSTSTNFPA
jgi:hypothetical protein